jgi:hypothetical protein
MRSAESMLGWLAREAGVGECAYCDRRVWNLLVNGTYLGRRYHLSCALRAGVLVFRLPGRTHR